MCCSEYTQKRLQQTTTLCHTHSTCAREERADKRIADVTVIHCNSLQNTATHCNTLQHTTSFCLERARDIVCVIAREPVCVLLSRDRMCTCSVLQCGAVCCSVLQCGAVCCSVLQRVAVCCSIYRMCTSRYRYGVATISRLLKIIGLFCRTSSLL